MPVAPREQLLAKLSDAAARMKRVREAAERLKLIRAGDEPSPLPRPGELGQPAAGFIGQPERTD